MGRVDPNPGSTTYYDFDAFGNLNRIQDPIGAVSTGNYNLRGFRNQWADADRGTWTFSGNSLNELVAWTDARSQSFSAAYDALGRMTSRTEPEGVSVWTWGTSQPDHNIGALQSVSGYGYAENLAYDSLGRLSSRTITTDQSYQYNYAAAPSAVCLRHDLSDQPHAIGGTGSWHKYGYSWGAIRSGISLSRPVAQDAQHG